MAQAGGLGALAPSLLREWVILSHSYEGCLPSTIRISLLTGHPLLRNLVVAIYRIREAEEESSHSSHKADSM